MVELKLSLNFLGFFLVKLLVRRFRVVGLFGVIVREKKDVLRLRIVRVINMNF